MLQEEITQKTIVMTVNTSKLTANLLAKMFRAYLDAQKRKSVLPKRGKQSVKELIGQNEGVTNIEITQGNIKSFQRIAARYNVDFAVKKDKTVNPPKYLVFFKAKDGDALTQAFKEFVKANERKNKRQVSVKKKLEQFKDVVAKQKVLEKEKHKDRGQSL